MSAYPSSPNPLLPALIPQHSAVVEACAGSGKTWLLVSRLLRLLLAGAAPGELLAITFTRKAAEEMRARLDDWLRDLALLPEPKVLTFLLERGLSEAEARLALPRARGLLESVFKAHPGPLITTFHGWFFHLLEHAPLSERVAGEVIEHASLLRQEAWQTFTRTLGQQRGSAAETAFSELVAEHPLATVQGMLDTLLAQRAEWWAFQPDSTSHTLAQAMAQLEAQLGVTEDGNPLDDLLAQPGWLSHVEEYAALLGQEATALKPEAARAVNMERARSLWHSAPPAAFEALCACLLTGGKPRALKLTGTMQGRLGTSATRYIELHFLLADALLHTQGQLADQRALRLNRLLLTTGALYLETYQQLKQEQGGLDFTDAELEVAKLLEDETQANAVFMKLDTRWKHLLLDEFQDTNPLQWRILRAWLAAYGGDGDRPTVFLVGDPKQSIYRFRRADPRLFPAAADWLATHYRAQRFPQNETRRCAPRVVSWVNAVLGNRADYPAFAVHTAHQTGLPGWCECIPKDMPAAPQAPGTDEAPEETLLLLRDPLTTAPPCLPAKRAQEAAWVAARIQGIVGHLQIHDAHHNSGVRPARYGDISVLYAKRAEIEVFEEAFKVAGIPFVTDRRGQLLNTLEAQDMMALLACLVDQHDDLALAHVLKSPLFGLTDGQLLRLAHDTPPLTDGNATPWWQRLMLAAEAARTEFPPTAELQRAAHLLTTWHTLSGVLPVHDLLDHIYHHGNVSAHYDSAVPARMRAAVRANLEGFLALSLSHSGGRYPSLPRFLDEMKALRDKAGQEGPDEPPAASGDRIRMLTIHSAKGLESPVVFLIKAEGSKEKTDGYGAVMDWPPGDDRPTHFSLYGPKAYRGPGRDALFDADKDQARIEKLNLLYVAMTRAKQALFVSGLASTNDDDPLAQLRLALANADMQGQPEMSWHAQDDLPSAATATTTPHTPKFANPVGQRREIPRDDGRESPKATFGIQLHAWLEHLTQGTSEAELRENLRSSLPSPASDTLADALAAQARCILGIPELAPAFDASQYLRAFNEMAFLDADGQLSRIDRLVEFEHEVWVLDYKTGNAINPHLPQMQRYGAAAQALYPHKTVRTALVFAEGLVHWL